MPKPELFSPRKNGTPKVTACVPNLKIQKQSTLSAKVDFFENPSQPLTHSSLCHEAIDLAEWMIGKHNQAILHLVANEQKRTELKKQPSDELQKAIELGFLYVKNTQRDMEKPKKKKTSLIPDVLQKLYKKEKWEKKAGYRTKI